MARVLCTVFHSPKRKNRGWKLGDGTMPENTMRIDRHTPGIRLDRAHHAEGVRGAQRDARRFRTTRSPGCPDIRVFRRMEGVPLAGTSTCSGLAARWGKRTDHRAMDGHDQKCATFRATLLSAAFCHSANPRPPVGDLFCVCTLIDFIRQGLFAVTVDRNRGRWFELV